MYDEGTGGNTKERKKYIGRRQPAGTARKGYPQPQGLRKRLPSMHWLAGVPFSPAAPQLDRGNVLRTFDAQTARQFSVERHGCDVPSDQGSRLLSDVCRVVGLAEI